MACGSCVVAARRGALPEVCADSALLVEPDGSSLAAGVEMVLSDAAFADVLRRRGPARAKQFDWDEARHGTLLRLPASARPLMQGDSRVQPAKQRRAALPTVPPGRHALDIFSLRVLLLSPLPGLDPPNGDVTYTSSILSNPPPSVRYVTYAEALERGELRERARRSSGANALSPWLSGSTLREGFINRLRRREWLFREPFRFFEVKSGAFDLIHCHSYSVRLTGADVPLIVTNSAPQSGFTRTGCNGPLCSYCVGSGCRPGTRDRNWC